MEKSTLPRVNGWLKRTIEEGTVEALPKQIIACHAYSLLGERVRRAVFAALLSLLLVGMLTLTFSIQLVESGSDANELSTSLDASFTEIQKEANLELHNLAPNPSFENGMASPEGWTYYEYGDGTTFLWDETVSHSGSFSVGIGNISNPWTTYLWQTTQLIPVNPTRNYIFSVWHQSIGTLEFGQRAEIGIDEHDENGTSLGTGFGRVLTSFNDDLWHYDELDCVHTKFNPSSAYVKLSLQHIYVGNASDAQVRFDDIRFSLRTITVPDDYSTIQEAINAANDGDTIFVRNGTYYENVVVNKTLSLVGENREGTIIKGIGEVLTVQANDTSLMGFTVIGQSQLDIGIRIGGSSNCLVSRNKISSGWFLLLLVHSCNNTITDNLLFSKGHEGIMLGLGPCNNNLICGNSIFNASWYGLWVRYGSSHNLIFHNNLVNNTVQAECSPGCFNSWDNGCEGNYWSDYNGTDSDGDGIGDIPYVINENNTDPCPLMNPYWNIGDINHDSTVDIFDIVSAAGAYGATPSSPEWNPHCDIAEPYGVINIFDIVMIATSYGEEYTPLP